MPPLVVHFIEQTFHPTEELAFGRNSELCLDPDNGYLHRQAGRFRLIEDIWWLENRGSRLRLKMVSSDGSVIDLHPGASSPMLGLSGTVSLVAGPTRYEIAYLAQPETSSGADNTGPIPVGADTVTYGTALTPREIDFVVVLARNRLTGRGGPLPSHAEIAQQWGVSAKTVDNTFQRLRAKLRAADVRFVDTGENLVDYLVSQGFVTASDIEWAALDRPNGPRTAAARPDRA